MKIDVEFDSEKFAKEMQEQLINMSVYRIVDDIKELLRDSGEVEDLGNVDFDSLSDDIYFWLKDKESDEDSFPFELNNYLL